MQAFLKTGKLTGAPTGETSGTQKRKIPAPWVEKYRPRSVDDVVQQGEVVAVLRKSLQGQDLPNLLFYGPPGTGKTSTILAASRELFGDLFRERVLELNASDERGIQVIRDKVKTFAQLTASGTGHDGQSCPPFKIIILDEADSMTGAAQAALRRTMEKECRTTRFCLICNYVTRIIDPLTSRCAKFRFKPLDEAMVKERLKYICDKENVTCSDKALALLVEASEGDLRKAITWLQSCARLRDQAEITTDDVFEIAGLIPDKWLSGFMAVCQTNSYDKLAKYVEDFIAEGYAASLFLEQMYNQIIETEDMTDVQKSVICEKLSKSSYCLQDGGDEYLQLMDFGSVLMCQMAH